jgi:4-amino-4-deoxy-L-arabinose transferase-like glycosyltransferase
MMSSSPSPSLPKWSAWLGLIGVVVLFCAPLFVGLNSWDMRNDEAIYSYSADRILDTGEWLTPRSIPNDSQFLEKPPLKFWMIAAAMKSGLMPRDDRGMRWLDALMGSIAFIYVFAIGRWIAGPICGFVAVLALFTIDPLIFEHGLRTNSMEGPLFLCYCGAIYHFIRWKQGGPQTKPANRPARPKLHAIAVGLFFVLGFMTKFVAALFLPPVLLVSLFTKREVFERLRASWTDWIVPVVLVIVLSAPWFIYENSVYGSWFWGIILGEHVYTRFTGSLDPAHLHAWHYYFSQTWVELIYAQSVGIVVPGALVLIWAAFWRGSWAARLLLLWWLLPLSLMSIGTSKLFHYAYPFLPPLALGAGWVAALFLKNASGERGAAVTKWLGRYLPNAGAGSQASPRARAIRQALIVVGGLAIAIGLWTAIFGGVDLTIGGARLFRNSSIYRPLVLGVLMMYLSGFAWLSLSAAAVLALSVVLPIGIYVAKVQKTTKVDHPLRALRDCGLALQKAGAEVGKGTYVVAAEGMSHPYFYYLRHLGPWVETGGALGSDMPKRLHDPGWQMPILMSKRQYAEWHAQPDALGPEAPLRVQAENELVILLPGPFRSCAAPMIAAGGRPVDAEATKPAPGAAATAGTAATLADAGTAAATPPASPSPATVVAAASGTSR